MPRNHLRVVVTGMGVLTTGAADIKGFCEILQEGISSISPINFETHPYLRGIISKASLWDRQKLKNSLLQLFSSLDLNDKNLSLILKSSLSLQAAILTTLEAWNQSNLKNCPIAPERLGVVVAGQNIAQKTQYDTFKKYHERLEYTSPRYAVEFMDTHHAAFLSELLNIKGMGFTIGGASASGNVALQQGLLLIKQGVLDGCFVVGSLTELSEIELMALKNLNALYDSSLTYYEGPFSKNSTGFVYGQGSGCIFLESFESAKKRNTPIYATLPGFGFCMSSDHSPAPNLQAQIDAMSMALKMAGENPKNVDYINAHATGTPLGDKTELQAIRHIFNDSLTSFSVNSTKGLTGHCLWAAGVIEVIATIIQMNNDFIHLNYGLSDPLDEGDFLVKELKNKSLQTALSNSFGFGGIHSTLVIKKFEG